MLAAARRLGIPAVVTNAVVMAHPEDWARHRLLRAIHLNTTLSALDGSAVAAPDVRRSPFPARRLAPPRRRPRPPLPRLPRGARAPPTRSPSAAATGFRSAASWRRASPTPPTPSQQLRALAYEGAERRYGTIAPVTRDRLEHELAIIGMKGFADYFLVVHDIVAARPHPLRPRLGGQLDRELLPRHHPRRAARRGAPVRALPQSRAARTRPTSTSIFPGTSATTSWPTCSGRYPQPRAAMVANHNCFRLRGALREVAKVHGRPAGEIREVTRRIPWYSDDEPLERAARHAPQLPGARPAAELAASSRRLADAAGGHCRAISRSIPGGVVIVPDALTDYVPVEPAAKELDGAPGPHRARHPVREGRRRGRRAGEDRPARQPLARGDPRRDRGGARATPAASIDYTSRRSRARTRPPGRCSAPGRRWASSTPSRPRRGCSAPRAGPTPSSCWCSTPASSAPPPTASSGIYLERLHGAPYEPLDPVLRDTLAETFGVMVYQEDVVNVCAAFAGMPLATADGLRKALSKKRPVKQLAAYAEEFFAGAARAGPRPRDDQAGLGR